MNFKNYLTKLLQQQDLTQAEAKGLMFELMEDHFTSAQIAALLIALRIKEESIAEITGMAETMREKCLKIDLAGTPCLDIVGTGGDHQNYFNISTAAAILLATGGVTVAKHGNRSASSHCGSADVLEAMDINIEHDPQTAKKALQTDGFCFIFAPLFHPAMKFAGPTRKELGIRTIFNILGPLANPANPSYQIMGVADAKLVEPMAQALNTLGLKKGFVIHGLEGSDEISIFEPTEIAAIENGKVKRQLFKPEDIGLTRYTENNLTVKTPQESKKIIQGVFAGNLKGAAKDVIIANSAFGFLAAEKVQNLQEGALLAQKLIESGQALIKLEQLQNSTRGEKKNA